ncbi:hypothetical protein CDL15_Pgr009865 [Punica granatum]|uniref:Transmembrane protein n=1 Tax=Punica granatum TaxID=22663 RepID=A0A218WUM0_PUNGR|nr:hypothetical protein CDL15_Pgr009865 [Punica granatum]
MLNWGPVLVGVVLFVVLTPGLLFQVPGRRSLVEFGNLQTSGTSILVHSLIYFCLVCLFIIVINLQIYIG